MDIKSFVTQNPELTKKIGIGIGALAGVALVAGLLYLGKDEVVVESLETLETLAEG